MKFLLLLVITAAISHRTLCTVCPGGKMECPDGTTCCKLPSGGWGCCLLPNAVCCSDGRHCCPEGYTCDLQAATCTKKGEITKILKKITARKVGNVVCPDGKSECPDGSTCCKMTSEEWGCCPLPNAMCCSDGDYCCPEGYICDVSAGTCTMEGEITKMLTKVASHKLGVVVCPDGQSECPDGNTCCKLATGEWGCCPHPNALCCSDGVHCCPEGYTCNSGFCSIKGERTRMFKTITARKVGIVVCPDGLSFCPDENTCCIQASGDYACCPLPNAVCCSDKRHCCPHGKTCDVSAGTCIAGGETTKMFKKIVAHKWEKSICPDGQSFCPAEETCCKQKNGEYACCPFSKAVCCSDDEHCCPNGYKCDLTALECTKEGEMIKMFKKTKAVRKATKIMKNSVLH